MSGVEEGTEWRKVIQHWHRPPVDLSIERAQGRCSSVREHREVGEFSEVVNSRIRGHAFSFQRRRLVGYFERTRLKRRGISFAKKEQRRC